MNTYRVEGATGEGIQLAGHASRRTLLCTGLLEKVVMELGKSGLTANDEQLLPAARDRALAATE